MVVRLLIDTFTALEAQIKELDGEINRRSRADPVARRLMTIPGVGPITATQSLHLCRQPGVSEPDAISPPGSG